MTDRLLHECAKCGALAVPTPFADYYHCATDVWPNADDELCEVCFHIEVARHFRETAPL